MVIANIQSIILFFEIDFGLCDPNSDSFEDNLFLFLIHPNFVFENLKERIT